MALLIAFFFLLLPQPVFADIDHVSSLAVIFDKGDPQSSVGLVDRTVVEWDDLYGPYRIRGFDSDTIIFEVVETRETYRMPAQGEMDPELMRRAENIFVVKQLEKIYRAQLEFIDEYKDHFAADLETLLRFDYLDDGFESGEKQGYVYEIMQAGETGRRFPHYERDYTFMAVAEPVSEEGFYFTIDELGLVRFAESRFLATWGAAWDYADQGVPASHDIQVDS